MKKFDVIAALAALVPATTLLLNHIRRRVICESNRVRIVGLAGNSVPTEFGVPTPAIIRGNPKTETQNYFSANECYAGRWSSTVGKWGPFVQEGDEFCYIISGSVRLEDTLSKEVVTFGPGSAFIIPNNWSGTWETVEAVSKFYALTTFTEFLPPASRIVALEGDSVRAEAGEPAAILSGSPKTVTRNYFSSPKFDSGRWDSTPGKWGPFVQVGVEFCCIVSGSGRLVSSDGDVFTFKAGDAFVIPNLWKGTWETLEPLQKFYGMVQLL